MKLKSNKSTPKVRRTTCLGYVRFVLRDKSFTATHYENQPDYETGMFDMPEDARELGYRRIRMNPAKLSGLATIMQYGQMFSVLDEICALATLMEVVRKEGGICA